MKWEKKIRDIPDRSAHRKFQILSRPINHHLQTESDQDLTKLRSSSHKVQQVEINYNDPKFHKPLRNLMIYKALGSAYLVTNNPSQHLPNEKCKPDERKFNQKKITKELPAEANQMCVT